MIYSIDLNFWSLHEWTWHLLGHKLYLYFDQTNSEIRCMVRRFLHYNLPPLSATHCSDLQCLAIRCRQRTKKSCLILNVSLPKYLMSPKSHRFSWGGNQKCFFHCSSPWLSLFLRMLRLSNWREMVLHFSSTILSSNTLRGGSGSLPPKLWASLYSWQ